MHRFLSVNMMSFLAMGICAGCVTGEHYSEFDGEPSFESEKSCTSDGDCWDGDPTTEDVCDNTGACMYYDLDAPEDTDYPNPGANEEEYDRTICDVARYFRGNGQLDVSVDALEGRFSQYLPVKEGTVIRLLVDDHSSVFVYPRGRKPGGFTMVLLDDCLNSSENRIAWGEYLFISKLPPDEYYIVIFSEVAQEINMVSAFWEPEMDYRDEEDWLASGGASCSNDDDDVDDDSIRAGF